VFDFFGEKYRAYLVIIIRRRERENGEYQIGGFPQAMAPGGGKD
jgi:hypothetical protein